jgi:hypothetical protein
MIIHRSTKIPLKDVEDILRVGFSYAGRTESGVWRRKKSPRPRRARRPGDDLAVVT